MTSIISSSDYSDLNDYSSGNTQKAGGPFQNVFICGKPRAGQTPGKMYSLKPGIDLNEAKSADHYLINGDDTVNIILMFIRRVRAKYEKLPGKDWEQLTYFCYDPNSDEKYPEGAKIEYIFAGALLDSNLKPVQDPEDPSRSAFVYFRNKGVKCGAAFDFMNMVSKTTDELDHLSDDPEFEKNVVTPRRFITTVSVDIKQHPEYGGQYLYKYDLAHKLPDDKVVEIMKRSQKWAEVFDKQFDVTNSVVSGNGKSSASKANIGTPSFVDNSVNENEVNETSKAIADDFELPGI